MLLQYTLYSQGQSNQIYSQTYDTSQKEKAFEICETLIWIFKLFVVDRQKNMSASVLQRDTHKRAWETCEHTQDTETTHMDTKYRS